MVGGGYLLVTEAGMDLLELGELSSHIFLYMRATFSFVALFSSLIVFSSWRITKTWSLTSRMLLLSFLFLSPCSELTLLEVESICFLIVVS